MVQYHQQSAILPPQSHFLIRHFAFLGQALQPALPLGRVGKRILSGSAQFVERPITQHLHQRRIGLQHLPFGRHPVDALQYVVIKGPEARLGPSHHIRRSLPFRDVADHHQHRRPIVDPERSRHKVHVKRLPILPHHALFHERRMLLGLAKLFPVAPSDPVIVGVHQIQNALADQALWRILMQQPRERRIAKDDLAPAMHHHRVGQQIHQTLVTVFALFKRPFHFAFVGHAQVMNAQQQSRESSEQTTQDEQILDAHPLAGHFPRRRRLLRPELLYLRLQLAARVPADILQLTRRLQPGRFRSDHRQVNSPDGVHLPLHFSQHWGQLPVTRRPLAQGFDLPSIGTLRLNPATLFRIRTQRGHLQIPNRPLQAL